MVLFDPFSLFDAGATRAGSAPGFLPATDLTVSEGDLVLTMDLPGLGPEDVQIEVLDGELVVRGERRRPGAQDGATWAHAERRFGRFERRVRLPRGVDPDAVTASMDRGVLSLIVPKPARLKPHQVEISAGDATRTQELETATA